MVEKSLRLVPPTSQNVCVNVTIIIWRRKLGIVPPTSQIVCVNVTVLTIF
jgi:hypothetical protein